MRTDHLFLLNRRGKTRLITGLTPRDLIAGLKEDRIIGFYGTYPATDEINSIRGELYILGEEGGKIVIGEKTFIKRFFLSLLVFLAIFYTLVYLIPDPIALVDEVAIGLGGAILFSLWHRRRAERGEAMARERINIKGDIDQIEFKESPLLKEIELYLEVLDDTPPEKWAEKASPVFHADDPTGMIPDLLAGLERAAGRSMLRRFNLIMKGKIPFGPGIEALKKREKASLCYLYYQLRDAYRKPVS